jgi:hypothetical protein
MNWHSFPVPDSHKDGRKLLALQNGELFVIRFDQSTLPPALTFRYHRNRVDRHYRFVTLDFGLIGFEAQIPLGQPWAEEWESIWLTKLRGFQFNPQFWAEYPEIPA